MDSSIKPNATFSQDVRALAKSPDKTEGSSQGQQISTLAHEKKTEDIQEPIAVTAKKQLNAAIIESSLKYSNAISDKPLSLLLKTALQGINDALSGTEVNADGVNNNVEGVRSVEDAYESGIDFSPEATAERIVSFSTQFLSAYREQNPDMSEEESLNSFVDIIRGGIDQGFGEAKEILGGLNVLEGEVSTNIDKTYEFVQSGLQTFIDSFNKADEDKPVE